jgi:hypothetical protein
MIPLIRNSKILKNILLNWMNDVFNCFLKNLEWNFHNLHIFCGWWLN